MAIDIEFSLLFLYAIFFTARANFDPPTDNNRFVINFPGPLPKEETDILHSASDLLQDDGSVVLLTQKNEKYKCVIPSEINNHPGQPGSDSSTYTGSTETELLAPLLTQSSCSYKIEPYWTYELCHNKFLRQYHEEREAEKEIKLQEYYLGHYKPKGTDDEEQGEPESVTDRGEILHDKDRVKQIGGLDLPYYEVKYTDGTVCDLSRQPRKASMLYICHELGRGEIYELKEVSSCEYEVVILTQLLCSHPKYAPHKEYVNKISCHSIENSPRRPNNLINFELENTQARYNKPQQKGWEVTPEKGESFFKLDFDEEGMNTNDDEYAWDEVNWEADFGISLDAVKKFIKQTVQEQDQLYPKTQLQSPPKSHVPVRESTTVSTPPARQTSSKTPARQMPTPVKTPGQGAALSSTDKQLLKEFLGGDYCIQGGTGWWKHEFCYGGSVTQFHEDNSGKTVIVLGVWDEVKHLNWIEQHPTKRPKHISKDNQVVHHHYGEGDLCELTGKPRQVEVKLRCKDNPGNPHSVSIYLLETRTCEYQLVVESPLLCTVLEKADDNGIISDPLS